MTHSEQSLSHLSLTLLRLHIIVAELELFPPFFFVVSFSAARARLTHCIPFIHVSRAALKEGNGRRESEEAAP